MKTLSYLRREFGAMPLWHRVGIGVFTVVVFGAAVAVPVAVRGRSTQNLTRIGGDARNLVDVDGRPPAEDATPAASPVSGRRSGGGTGRTGQGSQGGSSPRPPSLGSGIGTLPPTSTPGPGEQKKPPAGGEKTPGPGDPFAYDAGRALNPSPLQAVDGGPGRPFDSYAFQLNDADGGRMNVRLTVPRDVAHEKRCIIYAHGYGPQFPNNSASSVVQDGGGGVGDIFWDSAAVIGIDARGHGARKGNVSYESMITDTLRDLRRVLDYLRSRDDICDRAKIGVLGFSMGGETAIVLGAVEKTRLAAVGEIAAGGNWRCHGWSASEAASLAYIDPANSVGKISPKPLIMANGRDDQVWKKECAEELHAAAKNPKHIIWWDGGEGRGHIAPDNVWQDVATWMVSQL